MDANNLKNDPEKLMRLAREGDTNAFGFIYELYFSPVYRYIYIRTGNKQDADDLAQIVFIKAYESVSRFQNKNVSPLAYFFTIARNTIIDYFRKKKEITFTGVGEEKILKIADSLKTPQELTEESLNSKLLHKAINNLTNEQQEIIILKFINELSNKEISQALEKTEEAIRQLQSRALKNLEQYLKQYE